MDIKAEIPCHIVIKARQLFMSEAVLEAAEENESYRPDRSELNENTVELERHREHERDPIYVDLKAYIDELSEDEQCQLIALAWLGRGDGTVDEWPELLGLARERRSDHTADYLLDMPLLAEHVEAALDAFNISCEDFENNAQ